MVRRTSVPTVTGTRRAARLGAPIGRTMTSTRSPLFDRSSRPVCLNSESPRHGSSPLTLAVVAACFCALNLGAQPSAGSIATRTLPTYGPSVVDPAGNVYSFPYGGAGPVTSGAAQTQPGGGTCGFTGPGPGITSGPCNDVYLGKVDPAGRLVYGTYLGGPTNEKAAALAVDAAGNLYVTGSTGGSFPTTPNAAIAASTSSTLFAAKLSADGSRFLYATYLPGSMLSASAITADAQGNAYVAGMTKTGHAYMTKLSADGSAFLYTKVLSGANFEVASAVAVDSAGNLVVGGVTGSTDFPVSSGAVQTALAGVENAFVTKLDPAGNIVFSTYLGGAGREISTAVQIDSAGKIYVAGSTTSADFPATAGAFQPAPVVPLWSQGPAGFIAKLSADGSTLEYASYLMSVDGVASLAVNPSGEAYLAGVAYAGFPVTASAPQPCHGGVWDVFVAHLGSRGGLLDATYFGGSQNDSPSGLALAGDGSVLLAALTGDQGAVLARIRFGGPGWNAPACLSPEVVNAATLLSDGLAPGEFVTLTGFGIGPENGVVYQPGPQGQAPLALGGVRVLFDGQPAPVIYAQSRQVNALVPFAIGGSITAVSLEYNGVTLGPFSMPVNFANPGIFRLHPGASTQAAALNQDGSVNGPSNPARPGSVVSIYGTGFGPTGPPCTTGGLNAPGPVNLALAGVVVGNGAVVQYAGGAPTLLCGVVQLNLVIPLQAPPGPFLLPIRALMDGGSVTSQVGATITVK